MVKASAFCDHIFNGESSLTLSLRIKKFAKTMKYDRLCALLVYNFGTLIVAAVCFLLEQELFFPNAGSSRYLSNCSANNNQLN